ncbi:MAG: PAS domain S-box protein, partial [Clostridia bacterium]|nr:PAS domain S-box protein [Clostridia bacterium]
MKPMVIALINNATLLLVLSVIYQLNILVITRYTRIKQIVNGLFIAVICVAIMSMPYTLAPGIRFDTRSILIGVTALVFGMIPTIITMAAAIIFRVFQSGAGVLPGVAIILASAIIGSAWRIWIYPRVTKLRWLSVYTMSILIHVAMLACMFLFPYPESVNVIRRIAMPVLVIFPVASVLLYLLLTQQQEYMLMRNQLKQSEERFKLLFDKAPLGYQALDIDGNLIDVNQQWLDASGYSKDEVIGKWFGDFLHPAYKETFLEKIPKAEKTGQIHSELEMLGKSGKSLFISVDGNVVYAPDGDFKQTLCILKDITGQKKAEADLQLSERKYRQLYETMAQGVLYQAADGTILSANPAAEMILGLSLDQMVGKASTDPVWKTIREDGSEFPGSEHPFLMALRTGKPSRPCIIGVYQPESNDPVWITCISVPKFDGEETVPSMIYTTFQDITSERKANQQYQLLFNEMVDAFALHEIICDDQGTPIDFRFLAVNPAFEKMTGQKAANILGRTLLDVLPGTESYLIETIGKVALTGESVSFENYAAATDKYYRIAAFQPAPMQFACTFSDDTERVRAEASLNRILSRLKSLLDNSPSPIIMFDVNGEIFEISASAKKTFGLSYNDACAKNLSQLGIPDVLEKALRLSETPQSIVKVIKTVDIYEVDGAKQYFESRVFPVNVVNYEESLFAYLGIDITDRMMAEQALKDSEKKYSSYIENAPYAVFVCDEKGQYVETNSAASIITG